MYDSPELPDSCFLSMLRCKNRIDVPQCVWFDPRCLRADDPRAMSGVERLKGAVAQCSHHATATMAMHISGPPLAARRLAD
jgi:hypothetical protein